MKKILELPPFVLRTMNFTIPVKVAGLYQFGFSLEQIIFFESLLFLGASLSQLLGGYINDRFSSHAAFIFGKSIGAVSCFFIALAPITYLSISTAFLAWGIGVGVFEGSDFLAGKRKDEAWIKTIRRIEQLGLLGSLFAFLVGPFLFSSFGIRSVFLANALASALTAVFLFTKFSKNGKSCEKLPTLHDIFRLNIDSFLSISSFAFISIGLKLGFLAIQETLIKANIDASLNGIFFIICTVLVFSFLKLQPFLVKMFIIVSSFLLGTLYFIPADSFLLLLAVISVVVFSRIAHKIVFFKSIIDSVGNTSKGTAISLGNMVSGLIIFWVSKFLKGHYLNLVLVSVIFVAFFILYIKERIGMNYGEKSPISPC